MISFTLFRPCALIPTHNHVAALAPVLDALAAEGLHILLVDDGSRPEVAARLEALCAARTGIELLRHPQNRGKGAAVLTGLARAQALGFSHALQIDADGQHDAGRVAALLALARANPEAFVTGTPVYDRSIPRARLAGRFLTHFWVALNTLSFRYIESMCGFRVYPVAATLEAARTGRLDTAMAFDTEIVVRLHWRGVEILSLPVKVIYPPDNHSNFRLWKDNLAITVMHTRLFLAMLGRLPGWAVRRVQPSASPSTHWAAMAERGSYLGLRFLAALYHLAGRRVCLAAMFPLVAFFFVTGGEQRRSSRIYLMRMWQAGHLAKKPGLATSFAHFYGFAAATLDKFAAWTGNVPVASVTGADDGLFDATKRTGRGVFVLTAHFGNADVLRAIAAVKGRWRVNVLVHTAHAEHFNRLIERFSASASVRLIQVTKVGPDTGLLLQQAIENGEWVVMVGDRVPVTLPATGDARVAWAPFLGTPAPFPQGPHILAALLKCPVYLLFCLREGRGHRILFEPFAGRIVLPRSGREAALQESVERYAARLEARLPQAPLQWFNFFDYWRPGGLTPPSRPAAYEVTGL